MKKLIVVLLSLLMPLSLASEGFVAGTLVKTATGYKHVEQLDCRDSIVCLDCAHHQLVEEKVTWIHKTRSNSCIRIVARDCIVEMASDQQLYVPSLKKWYEAQEVLKLPEALQAFYKDYDIDALEEVGEEKEVYTITVPPHHNFFITNHHILAHNFAMPLALPLISALARSFIQESLKHTLVGIGVSLGVYTANTIVKDLGGTSYINPNNTNTINQISSDVIDYSEHLLKAWPHFNTLSTDKPQEPENPSTTSTDQDQGAPDPEDPQNPPGDAIAIGVGIGHEIARQQAQQQRNNAQAQSSAKTKDHQQQGTASSTPPKSTTSQNPQGQSTSKTKDHQQQDTTSSTTPKSTTSQSSSIQTKTSNPPINPPITSNPPHNPPPASPGAGTLQKSSDQEKPHYRETFNGAKIKGFEIPQYKIDEHIFHEKHMERGLKHLGSTQEEIFQKLLNKIKLADELGKVSDGAHRLMTTIDNRRVEIRYFLENNTIKMIDVLMDGSNKAHPKPTEIP